MPVIDQPHRARRGIDRRTALTSALVTGGALVGGAALAGCTTPEDRADDPQAVRLQAAAARAQADADLARGLAVLDGAAGPQLSLIADQRGQHANALADELSRYVERPTSVTAAPSSTAAAPAPVTRQSLRAQLTRSAREAGDAAVAASGYQAALLGSVAAATRVHAEVVLG
ncbi:hypothetical protein AXK60_05295 [Tsukamurella pseudospumae]|uniref:DUF4439 domain-containing protein n=1 Tax=Tsukamurella pseudospumae TaxID=239498 RepID=A0A138AQA1_9ACTN|nr:hypothetical protein AXK61_04805 [Tsukamurella pseudospumae]KXP12621.1 hypothetical protein AXK60_05295 [Tsukamurella pseudospumae]